MPHITANGYGCTATWDGETFRARGTNRFGHRALLGFNRDVDSDDVYARYETGEVKGLGGVAAEALRIPDELVLLKGTFTVAAFKEPNIVTNGRVTIRRDDGEEYYLHFRKKQLPEFQRLVEALG